MTTPRRRCTSTPVIPCLATALTLSPLLAGKAMAYDVNDQLKLNLLVAGAFQCQEPSAASGADNACRGAAPIQPELIYNPTERDQVFIKLGFAADYGPNPVSPLVLAPWAADLEYDVQTS